MEGQYVIINLIDMDFFKDSSGNIIYYDTEEDACCVAGINGVENALVMKLIYNHIEDDNRPR
jgi:uncharacterized protein YqkB